MAKSISKGTLIYQNMQAIKPPTTRMIGSINPAKRAPRQSNTLTTLYKNH
uniref:Uncharacterized protein n=1 Tax=Myoviridae sp. ctTBm11 TaxID=2825108 RepID=A0A8S5PP56_9CAUD|nr:MAG TPA: hypothetical protein [Myoviridae sp. ctTBm11]